MDFTRDYATRSLSEMAVLYVKNKILSGEYKSGDKLVESDISNDLKISRAPVREALRVLNMQGMVTFSPRRGNYIIEMSEAETMEVFEIRIALEKQILELLVKNRLLKSENYSQLEEMITQLSALEGVSMQQREAIYKLSYLDLRFHSYLWDMSGSLRRGKILEGLFYQLLITMNQNVVTLGTFNEKALEHAKIIDALKKNDLPLVIQEFETHIYEYIKAIKQQKLS